MRSRRVEGRQVDIVAIWEAHKDNSLDELRLALIEAGLDVSVAGLYRFFVRRGMTRRKPSACMLTIIGGLQSWINNLLCSQCIARPGCGDLW